jgi:histidine triad (HIT) family protein
MNNCIFCQIIGGNAPAKILYENEHVVCFLPREIEVYGHTLVVPKDHYVDLYDIPTEALCNLVKVAQKLTLDYRQKINATGMNLMHASGKDGQQSVFHFHFHLLPRFENDGLNTWPSLAKIEVDRDELWEKLQTS